jgi:hypothetical protein
MTTTQKLLIAELKDQVEPEVEMWVDDSAIFWMSKTSGPIFLAAHTGLEEYIDENYKMVNEKMPEGVADNGTYWNNQDFNSPFHISEFLERIKEINA